MYRFVGPPARILLGIHIFLVLAASLYAQIDTGEPVPVTMELPLEMYVDDGSSVTRHMITARVSDLATLDGIAAGELAEALAPVVTREFRAYLDEREWITPEELREQGVLTEYDSGELRARVNVSPSIQPTRTIGLRTDSEPPTYPVARNAPVAISVPVNLTGEFRTIRDDDGVAYSIQTNPAVNVMDWCNPSH